MPEPTPARDWCLDNPPMTAEIGHPVRCPHCPSGAAPVPPTHWTKHVQRHHPEATPVPDPAEPDNPAAWALARHIADHPVSTIQAAFRYLNSPLSIELHEVPEPDPSELTAEEARDLADEMSLDLYRAQDAIEFVREMCALREKNQKASAGQGEVQTGEVLEWLKGPRCGRQMLAEQSPDTPTPAPADVRDQIAAAVRTVDIDYSNLVMGAGQGPVDDDEAHALADAVLRVPAIADALAAVTAVERVRQLAAVWLDAPDPLAQAMARDLLTHLVALNPQEQP